VHTRHGHGTPTVEQWPVRARGATLDARRREVSRVLSLRTGDGANLDCALFFGGHRRPLPIPARVGIQLARVLVVDRPEVRVIKPDDVDLEAWDPW
jgi:hypothetical protein